jgi:hypothetical protein
MPVSFDMLKNREAALNKAFKKYELPGDIGGARMFKELGLQVAIFGYDVCRELRALEEHSPSGFALQVALKGIVLRVYECWILLEKNPVVKSWETFAATRGMRLDKARLIRIKKDKRESLKRIEKWATVRNKAAGHYDSVLSNQVQELQTLKKEEVMVATGDFLGLVAEIVKIIMAAKSDPELLRLAYIRAMDLQAVKELGLEFENLAASKPSQRRRHRGS